MRLLASLWSDVAPALAVAFLAAATLKGFARSAARINVGKKELAVFRAYAKRSARRPTRTRRTVGRVCRSRPRGKRRPGIAWKIGNYAVPKSAMGLAQVWH